MDLYFVKDLVRILRTPSILDVVLPVLSQYTRFPFEGHRDKLREEFRRLLEQADFREALGKTTTAKSLLAGRRLYEDSLRSVIPGLGPPPALQFVNPEKLRVSVGVSEFRGLILNSDIFLYSEKLRVRYTAVGFRRALLVTDTTHRMGRMHVY